MSKKYPFFLLLVIFFFVLSSNFSLKSVKQEDRLEPQIRSLKSLKMSGKKLGLVIGRTNIDQSIFSSRGEEITWSYEKLPYREDVVEETASKLNFDFLDPKDIKRLENLFSVVVIDRFSWNFLQNEPIDFMTYYSELLEKNSESCIFFEAVPTMVFLNNGDED